MMLGASHPASIRCCWPETTGANATIRRSVSTAAAATQSRLCAGTGDVVIAVSSRKRGALATLPHTKHQESQDRERRERNTAADPDRPWLIPELHSALSGAEQNASEQEVRRQQVGGLAVHISAPARIIGVIEHEQCGHRRLGFDRDILGP